MIEIVVEAAETVDDARVASIARSNLVKTAFFGEDPNWGRIISAAGSTGVPFIPTALELSIEHVPLFKDGRGVAGRRPRKS